MTEDQFRIEINIFTEYTTILRDEFFLYWSEPNKKGKMRFELEKTWDTKRRLKRWFDNQNKWNAAKSVNNSKPGTSAARVETARNW